MPAFRVSIILTTVVALSLCVLPADARRIRPTQPQAGGVVNLPYMTADNAGNQWMVYPPGNIQMQGNTPIYSQAAQITINGNQPNMQNNSGRIDEKTGELLLENMTAGTINITRRMLFNPDDGFVRIIDVLRNSQAQDQPANVQYTSNLNFGVQSAVTVPDNKHKDQNIAWVAQLNGPGKAAVELFAGHGSKLVPAIQWPQGNNFVTATFNANIPAGKEIAIVHFHGSANSQDAGVQWVDSLKEETLLTDLPKDLRKTIANFRARPNLLGDLELLRGDVLDAVELRSGDRLNGNLTEASYKLETTYGNVDLPAARVVSIINAGQFKPRQLVVLADGQIFGGHLQKPTIELQLSSGQKTQIPLTQISRLGYRFRPGETEDSAADATLQPPYLILSTGDRVAVEMPATPIAVVTRYGQLQLAPASIGSIAFTSEETGVHSITLIDGSHFSGLVTLPEFELKLSTNGASSAPVKFPLNSLARLIVKAHADGSDDAGVPTLQLKQNDTLIGALQGDLKLDTAFDTIALAAPELRGLTHAPSPLPNSPDISVTTWDGTVFSGQLQTADVLCHLQSGVDVRVPVALIQSYSNPQAKAPTMMLDRIKGIVADLNADDWKQRDSAERQLVNLGPAVAGTLKALRDKQPPEAQQRIDSVLKQLEKLSKESKPEVVPITGGNIVDQ